ncbi:MAG: GNAT family protein [Planctomycetota bacterium]
MNLPEPFTITSQIRLVRLESKHLKQWYRWFKDERVLYWISCTRRPRNALPRFSRCHIRKKFEEAQKNLGFAVESHQGEHLGNLILNEKQELSLEIGEVHYWGRRLGSEIMGGFLKTYDQWVGTDLSLWVFDFNQRAIRLYTHYGFLYTGVSEQGFFQGGRNPCAHLQFLRCVPAKN